jgi:hypothetical protein
MMVDTEKVVELSVMVRRTFSGVSLEGVDMDGLVEAARGANKCLECVGLSLFQEIW